MLLASANMRLNKQSANAHNILSKSQHDIVSAAESRASIGISIILWKCGIQKPRVRNSAVDIPRKRSW